MNKSQKFLLKYDSLDIGGTKVLTPKGTAKFSWGTNIPIERNEPAFIIKREFSAKSGTSNSTPFFSMDNKDAVKFLEEKAKFVKNSSDIVFYKFIDTLVAVSGMTVWSNDYNVLSNLYFASRKTGDIFPSGMYAGQEFSEEDTLK